MSCKKYFAVLSLIFFLTIVAKLNTISAQESGLIDGETLQTNPKDREIRATLTVRDDEPPSTPILISPSNGATLTDSTPSFVWEESTDNFAMSYYILTVDGTVKFSNIPLTDTTTGDYVMTKSGTQYTLTPTGSIADGSHTWKITAVDVNANTKDSVTWSFSIDSTAPTLVITKIGEITTSISAQDLSTLPNPYLTIYTNEPTLIGTSEPNSTIQLTVDIPSEASLNYTISVDSSGNWSQPLPILTRDVKITLNFIVTDPAGNVTALSDVFFMIATEYFFSTPVPTATPIPANVTVTPEPEVPVATPTETPNTSVEIPNIPPKEIAKRIFDALVPQALTDQIPQAVKDLGNLSAPIASAIVSGALPLTATALLASQFGWGLSLQVFLRLLQAIGILPPPSPQGLVFNSETEEPVPFAILNIAKIGDLSTSETMVTNTAGVYGGVQLPPGKYSIEVRHQDFVFPSVKARPGYLTMYEFYKGEVFEISKESGKQLFLIPVDPKKEVDTQKIKRFSWSLIKERLIRLSGLLIIPLFILSLLITLFNPTIVNIVVCLIYVVILSLRAIRSFRTPLIRGKVVDNKGEPLENVFVRIFLQESNQLMSLLVTDKSGRFKAYLPKGQYQVALTKQKYVWVENGEIVNFFVADGRKSRPVILAVMENSDKLYKDLFS